MFLKESKILVLGCEKSTFKIVGSECKNELLARGKNRIDSLRVPGTRAKTKFRKFAQERKQPWKAEVRLGKARGLHYKAGFCINQVNR